MDTRKPTTSPRAWSVKDFHGGCKDEDVSIIPTASGLYVYCRCCRRVSDVEAIGVKMQYEDCCKEVAK